MKKIPIGQTIAFAYRFLFSEIGAIVGIAWLPAVLSSSVSYLARFYAASHRALLEAGDPQAAGAYLAMSLVSLAVTVFASAMVAVAITRQVLGQPQQGVVVYFALGRSELRMFGANMRYLLGTAALIGVAAAITAVAFTLAGAPLNNAAEVQPTAAIVLAGLISWFVFLYAGFTVLRMGFLLPPSVVAEDKGGLRRSHELTRGNFWRALAVVLALGLPILLLLLGGEIAVLRSALGPDVVRMTPEEFFEKAGEAMEQKLLPWQIFSAVVFVLGSGLIYSGSAFAYRALVDEDRPLMK